MSRVASTESSLIMYIHAHRIIFVHRTQCLVATQIIVTQPRRIAAQELAARVAFEYAAGNKEQARRDEVVGFHVGGNRRFTPACRIKYMTEAVLLNEMLNNADLSRYSLLSIYSLLHE